MDTALKLPVGINENQVENQNEVVFEGDEIVNLQFKRVPI